MLSWILISMIRTTTYAVPAYHHPIDYQLPDGTTITIILKGDEQVKWAETVDGYSILLNENGFYEYTVINEHGDMVRSGIRAHNKENRTSEQTSFLNKIEKHQNFSPSQISIMKQIWEIKKVESTKSFPTTGNRKLIAILIGFTDRPFTKTQADFNALFNQINYTTDGATGSVKDYYLENSYGQFNLTVDVAGPYTANNNMAYYGANDSNGYDVRPDVLVTEAVQKANPDVNYADYDNDNNGYVDAVYVIYAGYGEEAGGSANAIWAHAWEISPITLDGKIITNYSCSAELRGNSGTNITRIGVICHEFGHVLGAPDYYDTNYATGGQYEGTGEWDLMASGSWNNNGATPAHHNGFTKVKFYNWATATTLSSPTSITMQNAAQNSNSFYQINTTTTNEYFFLEYREKHLFDASIPGSGLIIYRVHSGVMSAANSNNINATHPQKMYPVAQNATVAIPTSTPSSYGTINSNTCPWTGASGTKNQFTDATTPSMKSWAGANTNKPITNILRNATNKTVTFDFMGGSPGEPTNFTATAVGVSQINLSWFKSENRDVLLVFNTTPTIGTPASGTNYSVGNTIPGGGTVIYVGGNQNYSHTGLTPSTAYYYKIFTKLNSTPTWSSGVTASATTHCPAVSLPFSENFNASTNLPGCWSIVDNQGNGQVWQFGTHTSGLSGTTGNYAYLNSDAYGSGNSQNADLITPTLDLTGYTNITLTFKHYYKHYTGSTAKLFYSIDNGANWTQIQSWSANSANPATFSEVIPGVSNQAQVKLKWNYTGSYGWYWDIDDISIIGTPIVTSYIVNYSVIGGNGTLSATVDGASITSGTSVQSGKNVVFTAVPNANYRVKEWKLNNSTVVGNTTNSLTVNNLSNNITVTVEFEPLPTYQVTFSTIGNGTLVATVNGTSISSGSMVVEASNILFSASPGVGHRIKEWKINNVPVSGHTASTLTVTNLSANLNVTVEFEPIPTYQVTFSTIGNGTLVATVNGTSITSGSMVIEASNILFSASPGVGHRIKEWKINNVPVSGHTASTLTVTNLSANLNVTVEFEPIPTYQVTFSTIGNGTLVATVNGTSITSGSMVIEASNILFSASPGVGHRIKEWKINNVPVSGHTASTLTVTNLSANLNVTVEFEPIPTYQVTFSTIGNGTLVATVNGTSITSGSMVIEASNILFSASPGVGHRIKEWKINNVPVSGHTASTLTVTNLSANLNVTVEFEPIPTYQVTFSTIGNGTLVATVNGTSITSGSMVIEASNILFSASPGVGHRIKEWKINNVPVSGHTASTLTVTNLSANLNVTVEFEPTPPYTLTINIVGGGAVSVNGNNYTQPLVFQEISTVNIAAIVPAGIIWEGWSGDINSNDLTLQIIMNQNISLTANFRNVVSASINPTLGTFDENNPEDFTTVITWNDASAVTSIHTEVDGETIVFTEGVDYTITDIDGATALLTFPWGEKKQVRFGKEQYTYTLTIEFDLGEPAEYHLTYLWVDYWTVTFTIYGSGQPLADVSIVIENEQYFTNDAGQAVFELENGTYTYTISKNGWETNSGTVTVDGEDMLINIELFSGVSAFQNVNLTVYPNPATQTVILERPTNERAVVEIYSLDGKLIYSDLWESSVLILNVENFSKGIYQIRMVGSKTEIVRFIKQ